MIPEDPIGWVKEIRRRMGLTQEEFGARLGTNRETVAKWETGATKPGWNSVHGLLKLQRTVTAAEPAPEPRPPLEQQLLENFALLSAEAQINLLVEVVKAAALSRAALPRA
jgi:transcriptional regulator with XRE-family HTH domain